MSQQILPKCDEILSLVSNDNNKKKIGWRLIKRYPNQHGTIGQEKYNINCFISSFKKKREKPELFLNTILHQTPVSDTLLPCLPPRPRELRRLLGSQPGGGPPPSMPSSSAKSTIS